MDAVSPARSSLDALASPPENRKLPCSTLTVARAPSSYPWTTTAVNYPVGTLVMCMITPQDADTVAQRMPVAWVGVVRGILSSGSDVNADRAEAGVDQAFAQSKYLGEGK